MGEDVQLKSSVGVIGAGIQGICISLYLIKKGFKVTLIDREDPGQKSASYGNAGYNTINPGVLVNQASFVWE